MPQTVIEVNVHLYDMNAFFGVKKSVFGFQERQIHRSAGKTTLSSATVVMAGNSVHSKDLCTSKKKPGPTAFAPPALRRVSPKLANKSRERRRKAPPYAL